jgi:hypothetical protein
MPISIIIKSKMVLSWPHNAYNVFFILERQWLLNEMMSDRGHGVLSGSAAAVEPSYSLGGYESLVLPGLPTRYQHLQMPSGWFVPGKNSKRKHTKTKGPGE